MGLLIDSKNSFPQNSIASLYIDTLYNKIKVFDQVYCDIWTGQDSYYDNFFYQQQTGSILRYIHESTTVSFFFKEACAKANFFCWNTGGMRKVKHSPWLTVSLIRFIYITSAAAN